MKRANKCILAPSEARGVGIGTKSLEIRHCHPEMEVYPATT